MKKFWIALVVVLITIVLPKNLANGAGINDNFIVTGAVSGSYTTLQDAIDACPASGEVCTITVAKNVSIAQEVQISKGKNIILTSKDVSYPVMIQQPTRRERHFTVAGKLVLKDIIISGEKNNRCGGIRITGGTVTMESGAVVTKCEYEEHYGDCLIRIFGSGGIEVKEGNFIMNGGEISECVSFESGGGVRVVGGCFIMNGGVIQNNKAGSYGGGVAVEPEGTFFMRGGLITGNTVQGEDDGLSGYLTNCEISGGEIRDKAYYGKAPHEFTNEKDIEMAFSNVSFVLPLKLAKGNGTLTYRSDNKKVAVVDQNGKVTIKGVGYANIWITAKETDHYKESTARVFILVKKAGQELSGTNEYVKTIGKKPFKLDTKLIKGDGRLKYTSSKTRVATVSAKGKVTIRGTGKTVIKVTAASTTNYKKTVKKITVQVAPAKVEKFSVKSDYPGGLTLTWKRAKDVSGYQIQYARNKGFTKGNKKVKIPKEDKLKKVLSNLSGGKKYYVRIRAYKVSDGKRIYGAWSKTRSLLVR